MPAPQPIPGAARCARYARRSQRGVATLVVVMVLFVIVSLVAAYTSRNLVFEQRTSANQYRSTQALEAAQAGLEWALAMLNGGRIVDATCADVTAGTDPSFRQRYLAIDTSTGASGGTITAKTTTGGGALAASCVFNGADWDCNCPSNAAPTLTPPTTTGVFPAFKVRFVRETINPPPPGVIRLDSIACTRYDTDCLDFNNTAGFEGRARVSTLIALQSGLKTPPAAALTVRGNLNIGTASISASNGDEASGGIAVQVGGTLAWGPPTLGSTPGTPGSQALAQPDTSLSGLTAAAPLLPTAADRMFASVFGLAPATYHDQPAARVLPCLAGCTASGALNGLIALNPDRPIWVEGDLDIDTDIGSSAAPVLLVVAGNATFSAPATVWGVVYVRSPVASPSWATSGSGTFQGAVIAESDFGGTGTATYVYDPAVLARLRLTQGSFVFVPGSWKDFQ